MSRSLLQANGLYRLNNNNDEIAMTMIPNRWAVTEAVPRTMDVTTDDALTLRAPSWPKLDSSVNNGQQEENELYKIERNLFLDGVQRRRHLWPAEMHQFLRKKNVREKKSVANKSQPDNRMIQARDNGAQP